MPKTREFSCGLCPAKFSSDSGRRKHSIIVHQQKITAVGVVALSQAEVAAEIEKIRTGQKHRSTTETEPAVGRAVSKSIVGNNNKTSVVDPLLSTTAEAMPGVSQSATSLVGSSVVGAPIISSPKVPDTEANFGFDDLQSISTPRYLPSHDTSLEEYVHPSQNVQQPDVNIATSNPGVVLSTTSHVAMIAGQTASRVPAWPSQISMSELMEYIFAHRAEDPVETVRFLSGRFSLSTSDEEIVRHTVSLIQRSFRSFALFSWMHLAECRLNSVDPTQTLDQLERFLADNLRRPHPEPFKE